MLDSNGSGFSMQQVADRAGVTHRTVYNHFPTRDAMTEGLAAYTEELLGAIQPDPGASMTLEALADTDLVDRLYHLLAKQEVAVRADAMIMIANRRPSRTMRARSRRIESMFAAADAVPPTLTARQVAAAVRMFVSFIGWHLLTEHLGLSTRQAAGADTWATRTLIQAALAPPAVSRRAAMMKSARPTKRSIVRPPSRKAVNRKTRRAS